MSDKQYLKGFRDAKEIIIHEIARQYSEHNDIVPYWLSIGDIRPKDKEAHNE
jgi:hypothetical protein